MNEPTPHDSETHSRANDSAVEELAAGQRMVIFAILINISSIVLAQAVHQYFGLGVAVLGAVLAVVGVLKMATGLGLSPVVKILVVILMFVPCISLLTLLILNQKATTILKEAGYKVGLLGASK